jgi:hypothetical protein
MSTPPAEAPPRPAADGGAGPDQPKQPKGDSSPADDRQRDGDGEPEEQDQPQNAWTARRDLFAHSPRTMRIAGGEFHGGMIGGVQQGNITGGTFSGDVVLGDHRTEIYQLNWPGAAPSASSVEIPAAEVEQLAERFVADEELMAGLTERLRRERVLVLSGDRFTGRRTAALMLLHRLGVSPVRTLDRDAEPGALAEQFADGTADGDPGATAARGYVLCDPVTRRGTPLREHHLRAAAHRLAARDAYLVVTVGPFAVLEDVRSAVWRPPACADVLAAHLRVLTDRRTAAGLLELAAAEDFLGRDHQLREVAAFAQALHGYAAGRLTEEDLGSFSLYRMEDQVREWFEEDEDTIPLRDKAFLVALAAFDGGPYALTAELSDLLYAFLQETEDPAQVPRVPVFGTHVGKRLALARARDYVEDEHTEWGPVTQRKAAFRDERVSLVLLRELWTGHPSARPALIRWLRRLADDGRPLVRTRAASTVAVLARTDLPSAMALVIEVWATSRLFRHRLVAVNSLALAHHIGTPNIPRILDGWSGSEDRRLRWVATRAYALIGPEMPEQALAALRRAAWHLSLRETSVRDDDVDELADAVGLLLLSSAGDRAIDELRTHLDEHRPAREVMLRGFLHACHHTEHDKPHGMPLVLQWYVRAVQEGGSAAHGIPFLWRTGLSDPRTTSLALGTLDEWVLTADRSQAAEWALAALLPQLVTTPAEGQRLSHLLRTMRGKNGAPPPEVAARLLTTLPPR